MNRRRAFQILTLVGAVAAYATIVVGGDVRSSGAGMACGESWPICSGGVIPDLGNPSVLIEFAHRVIAAATSLLLLVAMLLALFWFRKEWKLTSLSVTSVALLVAQVLLGALTVQSNLDPTIVTAHLALGTATFASALVLAVVSLMPPTAKPSTEPEPAST